MKKLTSVVLVIAMLISMAVAIIPASAAGVYINQNFESMEAFTSQFIAGAWYVEDGLLFGYSEAKALQTMYETDNNGYFMDSAYTWRTYDATVTLAIGDDELNDGDRYINLVYCNENPMYYGREEDRVMMAFCYDIQSRCFRLTNGCNNTDPAAQLMDPVYYNIDTEGVEFITLGISVDTNRIRCFYNDRLIFDYSDSYYLIGHTKVSPFLFWQEGNFVQISNITVADQGYIFHDSVSPEYPDDTTDIPSIKPPVNEEPEVVLNEGFYLKPVKEMSNADTLVYDIVCNDADAAGVTGVGLLLDYSDNLTLGGFEKRYNEGTMVSSETLDMKPYMILWVGATFALPEREEVTLARVSFDVTGSLEYGVALSLEYADDNGPMNIGGANVSKFISTSGKTEYSYFDLKDQIEDIPPVSEKPPVIAGEGFYLKPVSADRSSVVCDLYYKGEDPANVTSVGLKLDYSDNLVLNNCSDSYGKGIFATSQNINDKPYTILWVSGTSTIPNGEEISLARLEFDVVGDLDKGIYFDLYYDQNNYPSDMDGTDYSEAEVPVMGMVRYNHYQLAAMFPEIHNLMYNDAKAPTCTEIGWAAYEECLTCGYSTFEELPVAGHDIYTVDAKAPTCDEDGWEAYDACENCDYSTKVIVPATGHSCVVYAGKEPTCTESGWSEYEVCGNCDFNSYEEIPALGHNIVEHEMQLPTCSEVGWRAYESCTRCDYTTYFELPKIEHSTIHYAGKEPTCTESGWAAYDLCINCDYSTYKELPATGEHTGGSATCTVKAVCDTCGEEYGEVASDKHGETEIRDAVEATADADGYTGDTYCKDCDAKLADGEVIPKTDSSGDVTGEGKINLADVSLILKYIAKWDVEMNASAADVTGDGKVNLADVSLLLKYIAKWDVTLK